MSDFVTAANEGGEDELVGLDAVAVSLDRIAYSIQDTMADLTAAIDGLKEVSRWRLDEARYLAADLFRAMMDSLDWSKAVLGDADLIQRIRTMADLSIYGAAVLHSRLTEVGPMDKVTED